MKDNTNNGRLEFIKEFLIGDLFFCNQCYNIHPKNSSHKNLGMDYDCFAEIMRSQNNLLTRLHGNPETNVLKKILKLIKDINYSEVVGEDGLIKPVLIEPITPPANMHFGGGRSLCTSCYTVHPRMYGCDINNEGGFSLKKYASENKEALAEKYKNTHPDVLNYVLSTQSSDTTFYDMGDETVNGIYRCPMGHFHLLSAPPCKNFGDYYQQWKRDEIFAKTTF